MASVLSKAAASGGDAARIGRIIVNNWLNRPPRIPPCGSAAGNARQSLPEAAPGRAEGAEIARCRAFRALGTGDASSPAEIAYRERYAVMDNPSSVALSGQLARERQMDVLANNIANLSTVGFKGEEMVFAEPRRERRRRRPSSYVQDAGTVRDWSQGPLTQTGNPLDVALQGAGFLEVQTPHGIRYTRDGRLKLDAQGQLVTLEGDRRAGRRRPARSRCRRAAADITIGEDGTVSTRARHGRQARGRELRQSPGAQRREPTGSTPPTRPPTPATGTKVDAGHGRGIERAARPRDDPADAGVARRRHGQDLPGQRVRPRARTRSTGSPKPFSEEHCAMRSLNIAATGMLAQQLNVEVISNNIANLNTTGLQAPARRVPGPALPERAAGRRRHRPIPARSCRSACRSARASRRRRSIACRSRAT